MKEVLVYKKDLIFGIAMQNLISFGLAFLEGLGLIASPCVLPILPILLSASLSGSRRRPFGVILGFVGTFALFTYFSRFLIAHLKLNSDWLHYISYGLLFFFGSVMFSTTLSSHFAKMTNFIANKATKLAASAEGFLGGVLIGTLVGLIWTPCAGPILAAAIVQIATQKSNTLALLSILSFTLGTGVPMLLIAIFGRALIEKVNFFKTHAYFIRRLLGLIIIVAVFYLAFRDKITAMLASYTHTNNPNAIMSFGNGDASDIGIDNTKMHSSTMNSDAKNTNTTSVTSSSIVSTSPVKNSTTTDNNDRTSNNGVNDTSVVDFIQKNGEISLKNGLSKPYPAPDFTGISTWINSDPLRMQDLKGKVVLIDFWTYSCINCIRTLPYLKEWYVKYNKSGFVIVGVHSPEFEFEKDVNNVRAAVKKFSINYPVALDDGFKTWKIYNNSYWPSHYLIDKTGNVVYQHFGEGDYQITEANITTLLGIENKASEIAVDKPASSNPPMSQAMTKGSLSSKTQSKLAQPNPSLTSAQNKAVVKSDLADKKAVEVANSRQTPETYLGFARADRLASAESIIKNHAAEYYYPKILDNDHWAMRGMWLVKTDRVIARERNVSLKINFNARKVFVVMGSKVPSRPVRAKVTFNGEQIVIQKGQDVVNSTITVKEHRLFEVLVLPQFSSGILQITALDPGLELYAFTFGS